VLECEEREGGALEGAGQPPQFEKGVEAHVAGSSYSLLFLAGQFLSPVRMWVINLNGLGPIKPS
jgi:hypothetical protein